MPDVEAVLRDLAADVAWPDTPDTASSIRARLPGRATTVRHRRWPVLAAAAALVALLVAVPGSRQAMADWLGVSGIRIILGGDAIGPPEELGRGWRLGRPVSLPSAARVAGFEPIVPDEVLGPPAEVWARAGEVSLVWLFDGEPVLLTQFEAGDLVKRVVSGDTNVDEVVLGDSVAYWIGGAEHVLEDRTGRRLAGNTLVWFAGDRSYRLESGLARADAIAVGTEVVRAV